MDNAFVTRHLMVDVGGVWVDAKASETALLRFAHKFGLTPKQIQTAQWKGREIRRAQEIERLEMSA